MGTVEAVTAAVREVGGGLRRLQFRGRSPNFERALVDGTLQLVNLQRVNTGVTGREPGFTVNLNVVHGALIRAWRTTGYWMASRPIRSGMNVGLAERLGHLVWGYDHWWHPWDDASATGDATQVLDLLRTHGVPWLDRMADSDAAIAALLPVERPLWTLQHVASLLVERPGDTRREAALNALRCWGLPLDATERGLVEWFIDRLSEVGPAGGPSVLSPHAR